MRVLIVEDERKVAQFLKKGFQSEAFAVNIASDGLEGLHLALSLVMVPGRLVAASQKMVQERFRVGSGAILSLETHTGLLTIIGGNSDEISMDVNIWGTEKDVRDSEGTAEQSSHQIDVRGSLQTQGSSIWYLPDLRVSYEVIVPRECGLKLHTSEVHIMVHNVKGVLKGEHRRGCTFTRL